MAVPTVPARLAEARSFVSLRMVDRAWVRLKDLVECADPNVEALQIAAQMFLLRGWQNQARKVVQIGLERNPGDPLLEALAIQAAEAPVPLGDVVDDNAMSAELVRVAEQHMARGAFVRARTLLERVRRRDPNHQRTNELLWAIRGEFASNESLASMCERWAPPLPTDVGADDGFEEPEHTVSARVDDLRPTAEDRSFPQLFRSLVRGENEATENDDQDERATPEVTAVRALADTGELDLDASFSDRTDHGEDTQIARVMRKGGLLQTIDTPMHSGRVVPDGSFNLADFRREMGVSDVASDLEAPARDADFPALDGPLGPEDEDDSLVIRTGQEAGRDQPGTGHDLSLDTRDERLAKAKQSAVEEAWAAAPTEVRPRILGRPAPKREGDAQNRARPGSAATDGTNPARAADNEPTARITQPAAATARRDAAPPAPDAPTTQLPRPEEPRRPAEPAPNAADAAEPPPEETTAPVDGQFAALDSGPPTDEVEREYPDDPEDAPQFQAWQSAPPPIAWPYWFFGLTAILAIFMMLFFLVAVASALL